MDFAVADVELLNSEKATIDARLHILSCTLPVIDHSIGYPKSHQEVELIGRGMPVRVQKDIRDSVTILAVDSPWSGEHVMVANSNADSDVWRLCRTAEPRESRK